MLLADIGNRHAHIYDYDKDSVKHLDLESALESFGDKKLYFISVNSKATEKIKSSTEWIEISELIKISGEYEGMGVDRKALCLSRGDGLYIDAGSAITVDKMQNGLYQGGLIFAGFHSYKRLYPTISKKLNFELENINIDLKTLQKGTQNQIIYTIFKPIIDTINSIREELPIYVTGGDRALITHFLDEFYSSETLVFEGMRIALEKNS